MNYFSHEMFGTVMLRSEAKAGKLCDGAIVSLLHANGWLKYVQRSIAKTWGYGLMHICATGHTFYSSAANHRLCDD